MKTKRLTCLSFLVPAVILIGSVIYLIGCMQLNFGKAALPAEGFLPLISGTLLLIVSAWLTVDGFIKATNASERIERRKAVAFCQILESIVGYLILLPLTGFIVSTMTVTMVSGKVLGLSWRRALYLGLGVISVGYFVFIAWLQIPFSSLLFG